MIGRMFLAALLSLSLSPLWAQPDARQVLEESVRLFSRDNVRFLVHVTMEKEGGTQRRTFLVARHEGGNEKNLLIRFLAPSTLECTAILTRQRQEAAQTYVYFPSIGRVRIVPRSKENREAVGLGISYADLHDSGGRYAPLEILEKDGRTIYRVVREDGRDGKRVYTIDAATKILKRIEIYEKGILAREVVIERTGEVDGRPMVLAWRVIDRTKHRTMHFRVDPSSVSSEISVSAFRISRLKRCSS